MRLTDEDRAAIVAAWNDAKPIWRLDENDTLTAPLLAVYLAGKRAGAEAMRERAAKVCADHDPGPIHEACCLVVQSQLVAAIRALGVDDE